MIRLLLFPAALVTLLAATDVARKLTAAPELTPIERIDQAFDAAAAWPLQHYSVAPKGDQIVPTPVRTLKCTKQFCDPHPKNLENLPPQQRRGIP